MLPLALVLSITTFGEPQVNVNGAPGVPPSPLGPQVVGVPSLAYGDSKSIIPTYHWYLESYAKPYHPVKMYAIAVGGATVASMRATVDSDLAADPRIYENVLINLGANELTTMPTEATYKANLAYIIDAMHAKWPHARVYMMRVPWRGNEFEDEGETLRAWIDSVFAARSAWAFAGPDESVFIENGDNGATYMPNTPHANTAGNQLTGLKWAQTLGYHP